MQSYQLLWEAQQARSEKLQDAVRQAWSSSRGQDQDQESKEVDGKGRAAAAELVHVPTFEPWVGVVPGGSDECAAGQGGESKQSDGPAAPAGDTDVIRRLEAARREVTALRQALRATRMAAGGSAGSSPASSPARVPSPAASADGDAIDEVLGEDRVGTEAYIANLEAGLASASHERTVLQAALQQALRAAGLAGEAEEGGGVQAASAPEVAKAVQSAAQDASKSIQNAAQ